MTSSDMLISSDIKDDLPELVTSSLRDMDQSDQKIFIEEFCRRRRTLGLAFLLWFLGFHYAYYKKWALFVLFWISCFLVFGLVWWVIDAFRIKSMTKVYNQETAIDAMKDFKLIRQA
jgi:hypothetical protein